MISFILGVISLTCFDNFDIFTNASDHSIVVLREAYVAPSLARIKPSKTPGHDGLRGQGDKIV